MDNGVQCVSTILIRTKQELRAECLDLMTGFYHYSRNIAKKKQRKAANK